MFFLFFMMENGNKSSNYMALKWGWGEVDGLFVGKWETVS